MINANELETLIYNKLSLIDKAEVNLFANTRKAERFISREFLKFLDTFESLDGRLVDSAANRVLVNKISPHLFAIFEQSSYKRDVNKYLGNFDTVDEQTKLIAEGLNEIEISKKLSKRLSLERQNEVARISSQLTSKTNYDAFFSGVLQADLANAVAIGARTRFVRQRVREFIKGPGNDPGGQLQRYTYQVANDSIALYDGRINQIIANQFDLNAVRYVGSLVKRSRAQCRRWVAKEVIFKKDIPQEVRWALNNGSGYSKQLTLSPDTFAIVRGGHNCRHIAIWFYANKAEAQEVVQEAAKGAEEKKEADEIQETFEGKKFVPAKTKKEAAERLNALIVKPTDVDVTRLSNSRKWDGYLRIVKPKALTEEEFMQRLNQMIEGFETVFNKFGVKTNGIDNNATSKRAFGTAWHYFAARDKGGNLFLDKDGKRKRKGITRVDITKLSFNMTEEQFLTQKKRSKSRYETAQKKTQEDIDFQKEKGLEVPGWLKRKLEKIKATKRWSTSTSSTFSTTVKATSIHEAYHIIDYTLGGPKGIRQKFALEMKKRGVTEIDKLAVSEYGASSLVELFAETGTALELGVKIPENIRQSFIETIKGYLVE